MDMLDVFVDKVDVFVKHWFTFGNVVLVASVLYVSMLAIFVVVGLTDEKKTVRPTKQWVLGFVWFLCSGLAVYMVARLMITLYADEGELPALLEAYGFNNWPFFSVVFGSLSLATYLAAAVDQVMTRKRYKKFDKTRRGP